MRALHICLGLLCVPIFQLSSSLVSADEPAAGEKTVEVKAQDLKLTVPASWKKQQPSNNLRLLQFEIPSAEEGKDSIEFVVFPPFGGSVSDNVRRWIDQFESGDRKVTTVQGESPQGKYVLVDLSGTYKKPDGPPILRRTTPTPDYRMVAVMLASKSGGNYFLKMVGPSESVSNQIEAFRKSYGADKASEAPYAL
ncbi:hypothetical protein KOR42_04220 [Thalassoglobus neptunius]|uniref:PsbP C-terminal domain-containing protein n=1 Tax=Thalassoglobus neptunius TaxID=1938619 RepID=A0A5C5X1Q5_9PLAN|nr:hypothetical protein [Thalassoglobus neptunius]TWT57064.1 hypothetical protein KOR42_04220 [Thalassoglobus neptunius]